LTAAPSRDWRPPRSLFAPGPSFCEPSGEQRRKSRASVVIAAINPQFAADLFDEGSNNPHLPVRFLRYAAQVYLAAQVFIAALKPVHSRPLRNAAANFALAQNYIFARMFPPEHVEDGGRL
jgi:hypothetical protein